MRFFLILFLIILTLFSCMRDINGINSDLHDPVILFINRSKNTIQDINNEIYLHDNKLNDHPFYVIDNSIIYLSDNSIKMVDIKSKSIINLIDSVRVTDFSISPSNKKISFTSLNNDDIFNIFVMDIDGNDLKNLTNNNNKWNNYMNPLLLDDNNVIIMNVYRGLYQINKLNINDNIIKKITWSDRNEFAVDGSFDKIVYTEFISAPLSDYKVFSLNLYTNVKTFIGSGGNPLMSTNGNNILYFQYNQNYLDLYLNDEKITNNQYCIDAIFINDDIIFIDKLYLNYNICLYGDGYINNLYNTQDKIMYLNFIK